MSNPWIGYTVCTGLAAAIVAALCGLGMVARAVLYDRREAKHTPAAIRAAREADTYSGLLAAPGDPPWDLAAPAILTGPHRALRYTGTLTDDEAARIRERFIELATAPGRMPMVLPDPPPPADETGEIPIVNAVYGIPPDNGEYVDDLFATAEHALAAPPEMLP